jgi:RimJ/RimL family protein N-acetyltransferase
VTTPLPPTPTLETERLILRPLALSDAPAIQKRFPQWALVQWLHEGIPWPYPEDGALTNTIESLETRARGEKFYWVLVPKAGPDEAIGRIDLWPNEAGRDMRGFWLDPEFWGQGLMTEAAERVTQYAFEDLGWPHLYLNNAEPNAASHRIKASQGAVIIDRAPHRYVGGEAIRVTWRLDRETWLARRGGAGG